MCVSKLPHVPRSVRKFALTYEPPRFYVRFLSVLRTKEFCVEFCVRTDTGQKTRANGISVSTRGQWRTLPYVRKAFPSSATGLASLPYSKLECAHTSSPAGPRFREWATGLPKFLCCTCYEAVILPVLCVNRKSLLNSFYGSKMLHDTMTLRHCFACLSVFFFFFFLFLSFAVTAAIILWPCKLPIVFRWGAQIPSVPLADDTNASLKRHSHTAAESFATLS